MRAMTRAFMTRPCRRFTFPISSFVRKSSQYKVVVIWMELAEWLLRNGTESLSSSSLALGLNLISGNGLSLAHFLLQRPPDRLHVPSPFTGAFPMIVAGFIF
jgi:hypothetical protein